jgi:hypothetical protein
MDTNPEDTQSNCESGDLEVNELCIVIWDDDKLSKRSWYVGICRDRQDESYEIEHITCVKEKGQNAHERWRWPQTMDVQTVLPMQILPCNVIGSWDTSSSRNITFVLDNWHIIEGLFQSFY